MTLVEEKKLVADFMGWKHIPTEMKVTALRYQKKDRTSIYLDQWHINNNELATCKDWDEIWDEMDEDFMEKYLHEVYRNLNLGIASITLHEKLFHTAKPDLCWKALLQTINQ